MNLFILCQQVDMLTEEESGAGMVDQDASSTEKINLDLPRHPRRRRRWIWVTALILLVALISFHEQVLTAIGKGLVRSQPLPETGALLLWRDADGNYDLAAKVHRENPERKILLIQSEPDRLQRLGLVQTDVAQFKQELERRGIPEDGAEIIPVEMDAPTSAAIRLRWWLEKHPEETICLVCDEFRSRQVSGEFRRGLSDLSERTTVHGLPDRRYAPEDWWTTRSGIRTVIFAWLQLCDSWWRGGTQELKEVRWDPAEYEVELKKIAENPGRQLEVQRPGGWLPGLANWLERGDSPVPVDYILILPGDQNTRPFAAAAMVNAGLAKAILIPRNRPSPQELDNIIPPNHEVIRKICLLQQVPEDKIIILPGESDSTVDDARVAVEFLKDLPEAKIAVVTSFYHTRRARIALENVYGDAIRRFVFLSVPTDGFGPEDWWKSQTGTFLILSEYVKLLLYWIQYGDGAIWIGLAIILMISLLMLLRVRRRRRQAARVAQTQRVAAGNGTAY